MRMSLSRLPDPVFPSFLLFAFIFLYPEWQDLVSLWWRDVIYSHGFAVLAGVLVLLWTRRKNLDRAHLNPSIPWLLALIGCTLLMLIGRAGDIFTLRLLVLPFLIVCWGCALWGGRFFRQAAPAIMLLIFAVPIWDDMSPIFQFLTVTANQALLHIVHIQASIHQFYIETPRGTFHVADGCSGVRYLMSGLFIASLYCILYVNRVGRVTLLLLIGGILAIVGNWIRVLGVVIVGYETHMQGSMVHHHESWGWVVFVLCSMLPFFWIARRMEGKRAQGDSTEAGPRPVKNLWLAMPVVTAFIVGSLPILTLAQHYSVSHSEDPILVRLPPGHNGWTGPIAHANFWEPHYIDPSVNEGAVYISSRRKQVELFLVGYKNQRQGHELVYYKNQLYRQDQWEQVSSRTVSLTSNSRHAPEKVRQTILKTPGKSDPVVIWSWYRTGKYQTTSQLLVKLMGGLQDLQGSSSGQMISVAMRCQGSDATACDQEKPDLKSFIDEMVVPSLAKESHTH